MTGCGVSLVELGAVGVRQAERRCGRTRSPRTACPGRCRRTGCRARGRSGSPRSCPRCRACRTRRAPGCRRRPASSALGPSPLDLLGLDPAHAHPGAVGDAGVVERLVDRLVGVAVLDVLADDGDRHLVLGVAAAGASSSRQSSISSGSALQAELLDDQLVELVVDQAERHLVDAELLVLLLDDRLALDVAEQGDLLASSSGRSGARCGR